MTLVEFLLARIAEDEERRLLELAGGETAALPAIRHTAAGAGVALSAQLRRISVLHPFGMPFNRARAAKYAGHPDYREEWRP